MLYYDKIIDVFKIKNFNYCELIDKNSKRKN